MAASVLGLGLLLYSGTAQAQIAADPPALEQPLNAPPPAALSESTSSSGKALQFHRDPVVPVAAEHDPVVPVAAEAVPTAAALEQPGDKMDKYSGKSGLDAYEFRSLREVPGLEVLTRLESEAALMQRMGQEVRKTGEIITFPEEPPVSKGPYEPRKVEPLTKLVEPYFLVHERLLFEQQNFERGQWDLGLFGPIVSNAEFALDVVMLPYNLATRPFDRGETNAGKCLPGDPSPFLIYPPEFSLTGLAAEAAVVTGVFFVFP